MGYQAVYVHRPLRFISKNEIKINEYKTLLHPVDFIPIDMDIGDCAGANRQDMVRSKVLIAFEDKRAPVFVDQTGLYLEAWDGLPGGLTELFWEKIKITGFLKLLENETNRNALAITTIGYCDGKQIYTFEGSLKGTIAPVPRGEYGIQWDPVFIPQGETRTFAQMDPEERLNISMRRTAAMGFKDFLLAKGRV